MGFLFWVTGSLLYHFNLNATIDASLVESFEVEFHNKTSELIIELEKYQKEIQKADTEKARFQAGLDRAAKSEAEFFSYQEDSLVLWTNNSIPFRNISSVDDISSGVALLDNGWYYTEKIKLGETLFVGAFKIKNQFKHENEDLRNYFTSDLLKGFEADLVLGESGFAVHDVDGKTLFSVVPTEDTSKNETLEIIIFVCYLLGFIILLQLLISATQKLLIKKPIFLIVYPLGIVVFSYFWLSADLTGFMGDFELFNPELFASSEFVPSLGDLIINITIFYFLVQFLQKRTRNWFKEGNKKLKLVIFVIPLFLASFYAAFKINDIIYSLVYDSKMSFDLERLFDFSVYSFISIMIIGALFFAYFKLVQYIIIQLKKNDFEWNKLAFLWALTSCVYIGMDLFYFEHSFLTSLWPILIEWFIALVSI